MSRPRVQAPEVRRLSILNAARCVLITKGYQDANLDDVAGKAKIAKGTLYLYFKDKESLFGEVLDDLLTKVETKIKSLPKTGRPQFLLGRIAEEELAFVDENKDFLVQFWRDKSYFCGKTGRQLQSRFGKHLSYLSGEIKSRTKGFLRPHEPLMDSVLLLALVRTFFLKHSMTGSRRPLKAFAPNLLDLYLNGLGKKARNSQK